MDKLLIKQIMFRIYSIKMLLIKGIEMKGVVRGRSIFLLGI